ncbi:MAG: transglutaminase family protein [Usitatibacteraceae bacterium]
MVRMDYQVRLQYEAQGESDFVLNICPARTRSQRVLRERLAVDGATASHAYTDPLNANRINRLHTEGGLVTVSYAGSIALDHVIVDAAHAEERPIRSIPSDVLTYILPSRFCPSDRMHDIALAVFGNMAPGYARVAAICDWVKQHVRFTPGASNATTNAIETFDSRTGVCRDYAHLMITICRALNIPARYVTGADYGADPAFGPPDFHAYVEVFLGERWYLFDPTGMTEVLGLIRIGTGRDAADVSFATLFGNVHCMRPFVDIEMVSCDAGLFAGVQSKRNAVSTANGSLYFHKTQAHVEPAQLAPMVPMPWTVPVVPHTARAAQFA